MKKIIALLLCGVFVLLSVSCGQEKEIAPEYIGGKKTEADFDGKQFIYCMVKDYFFEGNDSTLGYLNNTELADLAAKRLKDVEDKFNCEIEFVYVDRSGKAAYESVIAGEYRYDIIQDESYFLWNYMYADTFVDLSTLNNINATDEEKWGSRNLLLSTLWEGGIYGVVPAKHPLRTQNSATSVLGINENFVAQLGEVDPRDYYENGEWTYDTFTRVLTDYTFDTMSGEKIYALATKKDWFTRAAALSNGNKYISIKDGKGEIGYFTDEALLAFQQVYNWLHTPTTGNNIYSDGEKTTGRNFLLEERTVIGLIDAYEILSGTFSIAYNLENWGIVPFPSGPNATPGHFVSLYDAADFTLCIPITAPDYEASAIVIDAIFEPFEGYKSDSEVLEYLKRNFFLDERDAEYYMSLADNEHIYFIGSGGIFESVLNRAPSEALESIEDSMYEHARELMFNREQTAIDLYGE